MIELTKDKKGRGFILTQTTTLEGDDYHKQMTLSPKELAQLQVEILNLK